MVMNNKDRFARMQASRMKKICHCRNHLVKNISRESLTAFIDSAVSAAAYPEFPEANISRIEVEEYLRDLRGQFHAEPRK